MKCSCFGDKNTCQIILRYFCRYDSLMIRKINTFYQSVHLLTAIPAPLYGIVFYSLASIQDQCYFQN